MPKYRSLIWSTSKTTQEDKFSMNKISLLLRLKFKKKTKL